MNKMLNKKYLNGLILAGLFLIFSLVAFSIYSEKAGKNFWRKEIKEIRIGENVFRAEIAATSAKRNRGLSGRENLCENCAMLFLFDEKRQWAFWMKDMNFDLDIIWIEDDEVIHIAKNASHKKELEIIEPEGKANKVLEINGGLADKLGIKTRDKIEF